MAPKEDTKKDVQRLIFLNAQTNNSHKFKFYVGVFGRNVKKDEALGKGY